MICVCSNGMQLTREQIDAISNMLAKVREQIVNLAEAVINVFKMIAERIDWSKISPLLYANPKKKRQRKKHQRKLERLLVSQVLDRSPMRKVIRSHC
ncbi:hypothetical protein E0485_21735 [Paenibacillus albiflavus]|uniref:Uncharacterized protein n=1 Tax=Paenibacillus albiflavus TaxID=2545760 RepID=A0A4R4E2N3_9BACL|nr:hypothetical protein [Paenibacillus albiflavus]TCZ73043.1 hypothetical protein E0485_21735 [Paenibacillus albiflavus]